MGQRLGDGPLSPSHGHMDTRPSIASALTLNVLFKVLGTATSLHTRTSPVSFLNALSSALIDSIPLFVFFQAKERLFLPRCNQNLRSFSKRAISFASTLNQKIRLPNTEQISPTANSAVLFLSSKIGLTSTMSILNT